ncbi:hypothetical protein POTOM_012838 [Populus tomentosa]|uniref:Uncharacterized protein n=1 Tax=Populus tomentosa TaxID=118781 RepID=A0A8X8A7R8_POPTO|nr:hypothetical protein POTOM_012838 [Populus tomentosa]
MNWNTLMDGHYVNASYPYNSAGSFIEYFEGLTYDHVNFIFNGASHVQIEDSVYPSMNANFYKFGLSPPGSASYYDPAYVYEVHNHGLRNEEYRRPPLENSSTATNEQTSRVNTEWEVNENRSSHDDPVECLRRHHNVQDYQAIWQDHVDPDNMTYEWKFGFMDSSFTVLAVGIEIALYKVASINVLTQVCVSFAKWNISEVIVRSLYHANIFTMLVAGPDGSASIRPAPSATQRFLVMHQNIKQCKPVLDNYRLTIQDGFTFAIDSPEAAVWIRSILYYVDKSSILTKINLSFREEIQVIW